MISFIAPCAQSAPVRRPRSVSSPPLIPSTLPPSKPSSPARLPARLPSGVSEAADGALVAEVRALCHARGALGRGIRAILRAFRRRSAHLSLANPVQAPLLYLELGPAYVRSASLRPQYPEHAVSRYAVETVAWPRFRRLLQWSETSTMEAKRRGAPLRELMPGQRYGRHLFLTPDALHVVLQVAAELPEAYALAGDTPPEAVVQLRKTPRPGVAVAARCPRGDRHTNNDRNPSLILWMNDDGKTGGAMCPVCLDHSANVSPKPQLTWRVHYLSSQAALFAPRKRLVRPNYVDSMVKAYAKQEVGAEGAQVGKPRHLPVGGAVLSNATRLSHLGRSVNLAYVTAILRLTSICNTTSTVDIDGIRSRTAGSMAKQQCPMQLLQWSDRRSKGPLTSKRVEQTHRGLRHQQLSVHHLVDDVLPTPLVSVSLMMPTGWRDVVSPGGNPIAVPAGWQPSAQEWILFDVDRLTSINEHVMPEAAKKVVLVIRRDKQLSGRCMVIQTSPTGVHVWAQLREVRDEPRVWFKNNDVRKWYSSLGKKVLKALHKGGLQAGSIDMSSCSAGRFARRPGWRVLHDGSLFRSHVVMCVPSPVRGRKPRLT